MSFITISLSFQKPGALYSYLSKSLDMFSEETLCRACKDCVSQT